MTTEAETKKHEHKLYVDGTPYEYGSELITGAQIKALANINPTYQVFEEVQGDHPDKPIADGESVSLAGEIKHFYAVPPATFGS